MVNTVVSLLPNRFCCVKTLHFAKPERSLHVCNAFSSLFSDSVISSFFWLTAEETAGGSHISCHVEKTANGCSFLNQHLFSFFILSFFFFKKSLYLFHNLLKQRKSDIASPDTLSSCQFFKSKFSIKRGPSLILLKSHYFSCGQHDTQHIKVK